MSLPASQIIPPPSWGSRRRIGDRRAQGSPHNPPYTAAGTAPRTSPNGYTTFATTRLYVGKHVRSLQKLLRPPTAGASSLHAYLERSWGARIRRKLSERPSFQPSRMYKRDSGPSHKPRQWAQRWVQQDIKQIYHEQHVDKSTIC